MEKDDKYISIRQFTNYCKKHNFFHLLNDYSLNNKNVPLEEFVENIFNMLRMRNSSDAIATSTILFILTDWTIDFYSITEDKEMRKCYFNICNRCNYLIADN